MAKEGEMRIEAPVGGFIEAVDPENGVAHVQIYGKVRGSDEPGDALYSMDCLVAYRRTEEGEVAEVKQFDNKVIDGMLGREVTRAAFSPEELALVGISRDRIRALEGKTPLSALELPLGEGEALRRLKLPSENSVHPSATLLFRISERETLKIGSDGAPLDHDSKPIVRAAVTK